MTKDVIELAREAGMNPNADKGAVNALGSSVPQHWLEHFAALVAARERERIATWIEPQRNDVPATGYEFALAIRALNTEGEVLDATTAQKGESK